MKYASLYVAMLEHSKKVVELVEDTRRELDKRVEGIDLNRVAVFKRRKMVKELMEIATTAIEGCAGRKTPERDKAVEEYRNAFGEYPRVPTQKEVMQYLHLMWSMGIDSQVFSGTTGDMSNAESKYGNSEYAMKIASCIALTPGSAKVVTHCVGRFRKVLEKAAG